MKKKTLFAKLNIQGVGTNTYYGDTAVEKAEKYLKDNYNMNPGMEVYLEVTYQIVTEEEVRK